MSSRYMNYLRKNSKYIMVVMCIVCMITFVVGSALLDLASRVQNSAQNPNPVVVTWTKGAVRDTELGMLRYRHEYAHRFLEQVVVTALERGARPIINGRPASLEQGFDVGIPSDRSEETAIQTMVLAEEARRMGVTVDLDAVKAYLKQISSPELREGDWLDIAQRVLGNESNMSVGQLFEHLAYELKAQHVRMLAMTGLYAQGAGPIVPPGEAFSLYGRLNRRFAIEAFPVEVQPFVSEVKAEPTPAEIQKLFDEGKHRDPNPNIDEPGFHKPHKLAFKSLKVSFAPFLDEAKKQINDQQIEEAYWKDISQGLHKVQELPPASGAPGESKDAEKKEPDAKEPEKKDGEQPPAEKPTDSAQPADKPANEKSGCETEQEPPAATTPPPAESKPADAKAADAKPADEKPADSKDEKPTETPPAKEQKFKPLSEVREEIRTRLAQPIAEEARKKAVAEVTTAIDKYGKAYRRYLDVKSIRKTADIKEPEKLDLAPLAAKYNFPIAETPLVDQYEIAKHEIGQKVQQIDMAAIQMRQFRMMNFAEIAYGRDQPLFSAQEARSSEPDVNYIYFRTAEEKAANVTLKEARPQVIEFWKKQKAYELALAHAKSLAEKAKSAASLAEAAPGATPIITPPPFAWMSSGGFGFQRPEMSAVEGIELPGHEFMEAVFALKPTETGVAPDQAHSKVYVVRVINQQPEDEQLRTQFLESGYNNMILMLAQGEALQTSIEWYRGIADQYKVEWIRPPQDQRSM